MPFTYDDLLKIPEESHYEILDGECIVNRSRTLRHQEVLGNLAFRLRKYLDAARLGEIFALPVDVVFTPTWVVKPDMLYVQSRRKSIMTETNITGAPDLIAEVVWDDTRRKDEITKRYAYETFGVGEYWLIDPDNQCVKVYRRNDTGRYDTIETGGAAFTSPLFPGLEISLAEVFAE